jgi:hypothetical protein
MSGHGQWPRWRTLQYIMSNAIKRQLPKTQTSIKRVLSELFRELHKVALGVCDLILQARLLCVLTCPADLEVVVVQADDVHVRESCDLAGRAADTAADVEDAHAGLEGHGGGEVVLVAGKGGGESLALIESREVEGL